METKAELVDASAYMEFGARQLNFPADEITWTAE